MKREAPSAERELSSDDEERLAKVPRLDIPTETADSFETENDRTKSERRFNPFEQGATVNSHMLEDQTARSESSTNVTSELEEGVYRWIPAPSETNGIETMSEPVSKWSPSDAIAANVARDPSLALESSEGCSINDTKSAAYKAYNYRIVLEQKGYFMRASPTGPMPDDIALCERLLNQPIEVPQGTMFDDGYMERFHQVLQNQSKERLLVDLHPLMMPSAENQFIRGNQSLKDVIDSYNVPWDKSIPIYGPQPQPDHARGLKWSTFSESQREKLGIQPDVRSPYTAREDMYFPYLTAEIKGPEPGLDFADNQNMHSMCVALKAIISLQQAVGCAEQLHRRILGFSISHNLDEFRIYGYYPEFVEHGKVLFYRWPIANDNIWTKEHRWTCYRFVQNLDREFLSIHTKRVMQILERLPGPDEERKNVNANGLDPQASTVESQDNMDYRRAESSQSYESQSELRLRLQSLQQQLADQKDRQAKREAEHNMLVHTLEQQLAYEKGRAEKRDSEQKERDKLLADERKRLLAQLEQQRSEQSALQGKLLAFLENNKSN